jgi:cell shape-determining protein MreD
MLFNALIFFLVLTSFAAQEFMPSISIAHHAIVSLPALTFFAAAVATPFPYMLFLAFITGLIWDARYLPLVTDASAGISSTLSLAGQEASLLSGGQLAFGSSILIFALCGSLMQGIRPLFRRGRLELPILMIAVAVLLWLLTQYLIITFIRGSVSFPPAIWLKMITTTLLSVLAAPILLGFMLGTARLLNHEIRYDGLRKGFYGR